MLDMIFPARLIRALDASVNPISYPCPACGFEVFDDAPGSYDLCPVCDWEDDGVQLRYPSMRGGANGREPL
jgi:hypothetical protein